MSMWICSSIRALNPKRHDHQQDFVSKCTGINLIRWKAVQVASVRAAFYIGTSHHAAPRLDQSPSRTETEFGGARPLNVLWNGEAREKVRSSTCRKASRLQEAFQHALVRTASPALPKTHSGYCNDIPAAI